MGLRQIILYAVGYWAGLYIMYIIIYNKHVWLMYKLSLLTNTVEAVNAKIASGFATFEVIFIMFFIFYILFLIVLLEGNVSRERLTRFNFFYWTFFGIIFFFFLLMCKHAWLL